MPQRPSPTQDEVAREVWEDESPAQGDPPWVSDGTRLEHDSMGDIEVARDRYWGAQTERSIRFFAIGSQRMPVDLVHAYGAIKAACAEANAELGALPSPKAQLIVRAAEEVAAGMWDDHFPVGVYTTGSGTHLNANANEVIANRANELHGEPLGARRPVHPNDDVNRSQSSNDTFITAMHVAMLWRLEELLRDGQGLLHELASKRDRWQDVPKMGRTHLMDATRLTAGQEWGAFHASLGGALGRVARAAAALLPVALGGTAVGSGVTAPEGFRHRAVAHLAERTGLEVREPADPFAAQSTVDAMLHAHGALRDLSVVLFKIANDIRWMSSGPRAGLQELRIPENEPGSTIMPGKVNPTQAEALMMVSIRVQGNDLTVALAAAEGNFQLNAFRPIVADAALQSARLLGDAMRSFSEHLVQGARLNEEQLSSNLERSLMGLTVLAPRIGYDRAAAIARRAVDEGLTARAAALAEGLPAELIADLP